MDEITFASRGVPCMARSANPVLPRGRGCARGELASR